MSERTALQITVALEPWRQRIGYPPNLSDPLWTPEKQEECDGDISWEGPGSKYWHCLKCGYIGWSTVPKHYPVQHPQDYHDQSRVFFLQQRMKQGVARKIAEYQALFLAGAILRMTALRSPEELGELVTKLSKL